MINLKEFTKNIPEQLTQKLGIINEEKIIEKPASVIVCGMGGSGVIGDLLQSLFPTIDIHIHKGYGLPKNASPESLFIIISYSGDTEETLSAYEEATSPKLTGSKNVAVIAGGGKLLELAKSNKTPYIKVPWDKNIPARFNVGHLLGAALEILGEKVKETSTSTELKVNEELAKELIDKPVHIYTPLELAGLGLFWKEVLNETAKLSAFDNTLPEASHNEIESINSINNPFLLFLGDLNFEDLAKEQKWPHKTINLTLIDSVQLALLTALRVAEIKNIDPVATPLINKLK